jgi:hypothetical protein
MNDQLFMEYCCLFIPQDWEELAAFGFAVTTLEPIKFKTRRNSDATRALEQES